MPDEVGRMQTVLEADTVQHDAALNKSADVVSATSKRTAKAVRQLAEAQALAAKYAADAVTDQGQRMLAAQQLQRQSLADVARASAMMRNGLLDQAQASQIATVAIQRQYKAQAELRDIAMTSQGYTQQMAASAAVRSLASGNPGIRSIERFIDLSPRVAGAVSRIFPLLGAAGLTGMLVEMGERGYEAFEKVVNGTRNLVNAFDDLHDKDELRVDDLEIENQRIQDQIDKLSGHPNDGLAMALLEAKRNADQLLTSLQNDRNELESLFKEQGTGFLGSVLGAAGFSPAGTGSQEKDVMADYRAMHEQLESARDKYIVDFHAADNDQARETVTSTYNNAVASAFQKRIASYRSQIASLQSQEVRSAQTLEEQMASGASNYGLAPVVDNSRKIAELRGVIEKLQAGEVESSLNESIYDGNTKTGELEKAKAAAAAKKEAAREASEAQRQAAERQRKAFEDGLQAMKLEHQLSLREEYQYWAGLEAAARQYPDNLRYVQEQMVRLVMESNQKIAELRRKFVEDEKRNARALSEAKSGLDREQEREAQGALRVANLQAQLAAQYESTAGAVREVQMQHDLATGAISRYDAAVQLARDHAAGFAAQLTALANEQKNDNADQSLTPEQRQQNYLRRQGQFEQVSSQAQMQAMKDSWAIQGSGVMSETIQSLQRFAMEVTDVGRLLSDITVNTLNEFNSTLLKAMTDPGWKRRDDFRSFGKEAFTGVAGGAMKMGEGSLLKALHIGKQELGTAANPMYVKVLGMSLPEVKDPMAMSPGDVNKMLWPGGAPSLPNVTPASSVAGKLGTMLSGAPRLSGTGYGDANGGALKAIDNAGFTAMLAPPALGGQTSANATMSSSDINKMLWPGGAPAMPDVTTMKPGQSMIPGDVGKLATMVLPMIPGFANGISGFGGGLAVVGERGPELLNLPGGSSVIPNHEMGGYMGGVTHTGDVHVDARGATDPAEVEAAVYRGYKAAVKTSVNASTSLHRDSMRRTPGTFQKG